MEDYDLEWLSQHTPKFTELRPHQIQAIDETLSAFDHTDIVVMEAPTGSGKTLIAEVVRHEMSKRGLFLCNTIQLQEQFLADFPYSTVLKGRRNYIPELVDVRAEVTCEDCNGTPPLKKDCSWCSERKACPYEQAKAAAYGSRVAVLNTAYFLAEANGVANGVGRSRGFVVVDEADTLERALLGYAEFRISERVCKDFRVVAPKKGSHKNTIREWLEELRDQVGRWIDDHEEPLGSEDIVMVRRWKRNTSLHESICDVLATEDLDENWIRDNDAGPLVLKPIHVKEVAEKLLWQHSRVAEIDEYGERIGDTPGKWLLMSGTIIAPEMYMAALGKDVGEYEFVSVESTFPPENRPIYITNTADMSRKGGEENGGWKGIVPAIRRIALDHPNERILVHSVSFKLTQFLVDATLEMEEEVRSRIVAYTKGENRIAKVQEYMGKEAAILIGPALDRGVDLPEELCRVQVILKLPYPYLGDPQVSARMHSREKGLGQAWYELETGRTLVQMTGRGVRSFTDVCTTYILDNSAAGFVRKTYTTPKWWREGIDRTFNAAKWRRGVE